MAVNTNGITFSGLASGLDTSKIISALVTLESLPIQQMQSQQQTFQAKLSAVGTLKGFVQDLQTKAQVLESKSSFLSYTTSVSLAGHVSVSASGAASEGTHTVTVNKLAGIDRSAFDGAPDVPTNLPTTDRQHIPFPAHVTT